MNIERLENETDAQLMLRVCSLKDQIGTWEEVTEILNNLTGNSYSESTYRKKYKKFMQESAMEDELKKERVKIQTLNLERNYVDRTAARQELYYEYLHDIISTLPVPKFKHVASINKDSNVEYIMTIADVHYGASFISMNNKYSLEEAVHRFSELYAKTINFVREHKISNIRIASLGDIIQGMLRINDVRLNDSSVVRATVEISRIMSNFLNELSEYVNIDYYHVPYANHTQLRPLGTKASELAYEDMEFVIGNYIKDMCRDNERITIHFAEEGKQFIRIPMTGSEIVAMHGHQIKNLDSALNDMSNLLNRHIDYLLLAHTHSGRTVPGHEASYLDTEVLVSSSFVGSDPYSDSIFKGSKAAVQVYGFDSRHGHTETYKFILN